jgi:two-component system sensor histidine kinase AtoS
VTPSEGGRSVSVLIEDNGCGIPPDIAGEIFKPFYTTKMTKTNTGLGLSICQHIAELHHGVITFDSLAGYGTTFTVLLPKGD